MYIIFEIITTDASCVYDHIYLTWKNQIQGRPIHFYRVGKELNSSAKGCRPEGLLMKTSWVGARDETPKKIFDILILNFQDDEQFQLLGTFYQ